MLDIIQQIASLIDAESHNACDSQIAGLTTGFETGNDVDGHYQNYMFFRNIKHMRDLLDEMLNYDQEQIDQLLSDGHDWASDHVSAAMENLEQVAGWLNGELDRS
jgi:hypothetical protein